MTARRDPVQTLQQTTMAPRRSGGAAGSCEPPGGGRWRRLWVVALTAMLALGAHRALAQDMPSSSIIHLIGSNMSPDAHLVLLCRDEGSRRPVFENERTGAIFPIVNPRQRAIAKKVCGRDQLGAAETGTVKLVNDRVEPIFVGYSGAGAIDWRATAGCIPVATGAGGVEIIGHSFCIATVMATNSGSRFCASLTAPPNCLEAQNNHVTLIEPTFDTSKQCRWTHQVGTCVSYDISIIPVGCTDEAWKTDNCAKAGGASYNLPVELSCAGQSSDPVFTCQGPVPSSIADPQKYPSNCGNPNASCVGNSRACVNAYFFPMFSGPPAKYQPVGVCSGGRTLAINFFAGH